MKCTIPGIIDTFIIHTISHSHSMFQNCSFHCGCVFSIPSAQPPEQSEQSLLGISIHWLLPRYHLYSAVNRRVDKSPIGNHNEEQLLCSCNMPHKYSRSQYFYCFDNSKEKYLSVIRNKGRERQTLQRFIGQEWLSGNFSL